MGKIIVVFILCVVHLNNEHAREHGMKVNRLIQGVMDIKYREDIREFLKKNEASLNKKEKFSGDVSIRVDPTPFPLGQLRIETFLNFRNL